MKGRLLSRQENNFRDQYCIINSKHFRFNNINLLGEYSLF